MSEERVTELLNVFISAFCKYGLDGTTTKKLAAEANLSEAGLYVYFKNKEDIILKCFGYHIHNVMNETGNMAQKYGDNPDKFVFAMFTYVKSLIMENRFVFQVMIHPYYSQLTKELRINMLGNVKMQSEKLQKYFLSKDMAYAIVLLYNSALNNYIITQDEEGFKLQMEFLLKLFRD